MPRTKKNYADYFSHDTDARNDIKIRKLMNAYGAEGYAVFFILCEIIYRTPGYELEIEDEDTIGILAEECKVEPKRFGEILEKAVKVGLFDKEEYEGKKTLTSGGIKKRSSIIERKRRYDLDNRNENKNNRNGKEDIRNENDGKTGIIVKKSAQIKGKEIPPIVPLEGDAKKNGEAQEPEGQIPALAETSEQAEYHAMRDQPSGGKLKNMEECLSVLCKNYRSGRNNKTESRRHYYGYLQGTKKDRASGKRYRYNHIQILLAAKQYMVECEERQAETDKVLLLSTFLNGRVVDYIEKTRPAYEKTMERHYGEKWKDVSFEYE